MKGRWWHGMSVWPWNVERTENKISPVVTPIWLGLGDDNLVLLLLIPVLLLLLLQLLLPLLSEDGEEDDNMADDTEGRMGR